ncbi:CsbD family protein [Indiicoccus explosivorum]|uniref:CsbD family protein n=1 Tax=Indiicoccus explosivorum TaxID=1917864 RepID=UPI000B42D0D4|nr:CsbD family protein [Indiicoccus explosivorum]
MGNRLTEQVKGAVSRAKGELKEKTGTRSGKVGLQREGRFEKVKGDIQTKIGTQRRRRPK